jgi:hypothetical protein
LFEESDERNAFTSLSSSSEALAATSDHGASSQWLPSITSETAAEAVGTLKTGYSHIQALIQDKK